MARLEPRDPVPVFRAVLLVLCGLLSIVSQTRTTSPLPIALLAAVAVAASRSSWTRVHPVPVALLEAVITGVAVVLTDGVESPLLPYLLASVAFAGGRRAVVVVSGTSAAALLLTRTASGLPATGVERDSWLELGGAAGEWVLLGLALGLLFAAARGPAGPVADLVHERYGEARQLLGQLRTVSRRLPGGLDVASAAESLLSECATVAESYRSAVFLQTAPGTLVPAAVRGTRRVPWRAPLDAPGPLRNAWESQAAVVDRREPDRDGRRRGSALLAAPLTSDGTPFGLVVLESADLDAFPDDVVDAVAEAAAGSSLRLETALLFAEVRSAVTVEERDRLAREIHDGIAQDLAVVGYSLDELRLQAVRVDEQLGAQVAQVRKGLTSLISDLRLSITDLKNSLASDRGLGSALSSYVRALGSGQSLRVHLTLQESVFRLPAEQEVLLFHLVQAVAQDVRRGRSAENLWVDLLVEPPHARLVVEHDGSHASADLSAFEQQLHLKGGALSVEPTPAGGVRVTAVLEGDDA